MKLRRTHAGWAVKIWVFATVFVFPFVMHDLTLLLPWLAIGGVLGLVWKRLPEEPEAPADPLPYADLYKDRAVPRHGDPPPRAGGEGPPPQG